jgi:hypothetical protein
MWKFDCAEGAHLNVLYAEWKLMSRDVFNKEHTPFRLGLDVIGGAAVWDGDTIWQMEDNGELKVARPGEALLGIFDAQGLTMKQLAEHSEPGSEVIFYHPAAHEHCLANGEACSIQFENTVKAGKDTYNGYPFGPMSYETVLDNMANEFPGRYENAPHSKEDIAEARRQIFINTIALRSESVEELVKHATGK